MKNILEMMGKVYVEILGRIVPPYKNIPNVSTYKIYIKMEKNISSPICVEEGQTRDSKDEQIAIIAMVRWQK